jgi:hypothetical protein
MNRAFVPNMIREVAGNAYMVQSGDNVGSISEGFTGCPMKYCHLVASNMHKPLTSDPNRRFQVFKSLEPGEHLNLPAYWIKERLGTGDVGGVPEDQLTAMASVLQTVITTGAANAGQFNWSLPKSTQNVPIPSQVAMLLAQWWPYLSLPPNNIGTLPTINVMEISQWLGWFGTPPKDNSDPITNLLNFKKLITVAQNYWNAFGSLKYWPWDKVPWEWIAGSSGQPPTPNFMKLAAAFGNNPAAIVEAASLLKTIMLIPAYQSAKNVEMQGPLWQMSQGVYGPWAPPDFFSIDWSQPPYFDLITWITKNYVDPEQIPWDLLMNTETTNCFMKRPGRLQEMQADVDCFKRGCAGDPIDNFKKWVCADTYIPGWCNSIPECASCKPQTCQQLGVECGKTPDGCGGVVDCGTCPSGKCGDGGPGKCATPKSKCDPPCTKEETCVNGTCQHRGGVVLPVCKSVGEACNKAGECCGKMECTSGKCTQPLSGDRKQPTRFCALEGQAPSKNASKECCDGLENIDDLCVKKSEADADTKTSAWVYVGVVAAVLALGVGGYAVYASGAKKPAVKKNPISRYHPTGKDDWWKNAMPKQKFELGDHVEDIETGDTGIVSFRGEYDALIGGYRYKVQMDHPHPIMGGRITWNETKMRKI